MAMFQDALTLDGPRRDGSGNMVASVLCARTGLQDYAGYEVGKPEMARVVVYRPPEEVFNRDSMRSFAGAPVTIEHPAQQVTPANWKDHAVGETASDDIVKDGEAIRVPFLLRDAAAIEAVLAGKREVSMGYDCSLDWTPGKLADGTPYDAVQRGIRINHLAIVDKARGGPTLRIGDKEPSMKIKIGDAEVEVTDGAAVAVAVGSLNAKLADAETKVGTLTGENATLKTAVETKDGEIAALTQKVKDAEVTPAKLQQMADARAQVIGKAKALAPSITTDGKADADIRKEAVTAKLGDAATGMSDAAIEGAFTALTKDAKPAADTVQPIGAPVNVGDAAKQMTDAWTAANDHNAWRTAGAGKGN
jgi:hypothetical protein